MMFSVYIALLYQSEKFIIACKSTLNAVSASYDELKFYVSIIFVRNCY